MEIKNLAQLKRELTEGRRFNIVDHKIHPHYIGHERIVTKVQTNGIYSKEIHYDMLDYMNDGKGIWMNFGKASEWKFNGNRCTAYTNGKETFTFEVL